MAMEPAQGFAMASDHGAAGVNVVTTAGGPSAVTTPLSSSPAPALYSKFPDVYSGLYIPDTISGLIFSFINSASRT
jgi:hypothetical protein